MGVVIVLTSHGNRNLDFKVRKITCEPVQGHGWTHLQFEPREHVYTIWKLEYHNLSGLHASDLDLDFGIAIVTNVTV